MRLLWACECDRTLLMEEKTLVTQSSDTSPQDQCSQKVRLAKSTCKFMTSLGSDHEDELDEISDDDETKPIVGIKRKLDDSFEAAPIKRSRANSKYVNLLERLFPDQKSDVNGDIFNSN